MKEDHYDLNVEIASARKPSDTIPNRNRRESNRPIPRQEVSVDPERLRRCIEQLWALPEDFRQSYLQVARLSEAEVVLSCRRLGTRNPLEQREYSTLPFGERLQLPLIDMSVRYSHIMDQYVLECLQKRISLERVKDLQGVTDRDFHRKRIRNGSIEQVNAVLQCIKIQRLSSGQLLDVQANRTVKEDAVKIAKP